MARKRYKAEEITGMLQQAEVLRGQGMSMAGTIRQLGISEVTYYIYGRLPRCKRCLDERLGQLRHHLYRGALMGNSHAPVSAGGRPPLGLCNTQARGASVRPSVMGRLPSSTICQWPIVATRSFVREARRLWQLVSPRARFRASGVIAAAVYASGEDRTSRGLHSP